MSGFFKDDLTVALDEVDRTASRLVTICDDLAAIAVDPDVARRLRELGERHRAALVDFNHARRAAGHTPEVGDPERAHLQSLWMALKSAVSGEAAPDSLLESLNQLDDALRTAVQTALELKPEPLVRDALQRLMREIDRAT